MIRSFVLKLNTRSAQSAEIDNILNISSLYYNKCCTERAAAYAKDKSSIKNGELEKLAITWKQLFDPKDRLYSQIVQDLCKRNTLAYNQFFERIKNKYKQAAGLPKEKTKPCKSFKLKQSGYSLIAKNNLISKIKFWKSSQIGSVKLLKKFSLPQGAKIKTLSIIRKADGYYAILTCDVLPVQRTAKPFTKTLIPHSVAPNFALKQNSGGIDLGVKDFLTLSNGMQFNCKAIKIAEKLLYSLNKTKNRKKKQNNGAITSRRYNNTLKKIAKQHLKIVRLRNDFHHKVANYILENFSNIHIEDLNILRMIETNKYGRRQSRRIHSAAWGKFITILNYKAQLYNSNIIIVDPKYTSQICTCGAHVPKDLNIRIHNCSACGTIMNRDVVSAQVIEILGNASHPQNKHLSEARDRLEAKLRHAALPQ